MERFQRICIEEHIQEDQKGNKLHLKRGNEYHTSREQDGKVMVFTNFWVYVPVTIFASEKRFTYTRKKKVMKIKGAIIISILVVVIPFLVLWLCKTVSDSMQEARLEGKLEGIKIGRSLIGEGD